MRGYCSVDYDTLLLLLRLMLIPAYLFRDGFVERAADWILRIAKRPHNFCSN